MNLLDMRTIVASYAISNLICMVVIAVLWFQNRRRFQGLGFWLSDFAMQFIAVLLAALRGVVPDFLTMTLSNAMVIGGTVLLYAGLERFLGRRGSQVHNVILLWAFILAHAYFVVARPSLTARNILISLALLVICSQCAWLLLRRAGREMQAVTRGVGIVFALFCLLSAARIGFDLVLPSPGDFLHSGLYDTLCILTYQMLFIALSFALVLMVNRRLVADLSRDIAERKRAEEFLRESEATFREVFDGTAHGIFVIEVAEDGSFRVGDSNRAEEVATTIRREDVIGKPLEEAFHPDIARALRANYSRCLEAGTSIAYEEEINLPGAGRRNYLTTLAPARNESGRIHRIIGSTLEITDRKRDEEALRQLTHELNERVKELNCLYEIGEIAGKKAMSLEDALQGILDLIPPAYQYPERTCARLALEGRRIGTGNFRDTPWKQTSEILVGNEAIGSLEVCYLEESPASDEGPFLKEEHRLIHAIGERIGRIIERTRVEESLRLSEEKFSRAFQSSPDAILITRLDDGKILEVNDGFCRMLGYTREEAVSRSTLALGFWDRPRERDEIVASLREQGRVRDRELQFRTKPGRILHCSYSGEIIDLGGETYILSVIRDISERRRAEEIVRIRLRLWEYAAHHTSRR